MINIKFNSLFVYSEEYNLSFYKRFTKRVNIISGRNTSGKSTIIQSFLYTLGINDVKSKLQEILDLQSVFRLDFTLTNKGESDNYIIVRDDSAVYLKKNTNKTEVFYGVSSNTGRERAKFKEYIANMFDFNMYVEQKGSYSDAPLEALYLPYYVSQSVGWVYLQSSFSNFNFYKNFRQDYLDYYLGISTKWDRRELIELQKKRAEILVESKFLEKQKSTPSLELAKNVDEAFGAEAQSYVNGYVELYSNLQKYKRELIKDCNQLAIYENHLKIVRRTKSNIKIQKFDGVDSCPACLQTLSYSLERIYEYHQKKNDNLDVESHLKKVLKKMQSSINSHRTNIEEIEAKINSRYEVLKTIERMDIDYSTWIDFKAETRLYSHLQEKLTQNNLELKELEGQLKNFDDETVSILRKNKESTFRKIFKIKLSELDVKPLEEARHLDVYSINSFPYQGVELHSTMLAYHLSFNQIISKNQNIHRLPLLLDGILKEDIDPKSLVKIFKFLSENLPQDTQSFITISDYRVGKYELDEEEGNLVKRFSVEDIKKDYFGDDADVIYVSENEEKRAFLSQPLNKNSEIYLDTLNIISI